MRILQVITLSDLGGAQTVVRELANGFTVRGHEVGVASAAGGPLWDALDRRVQRFPLVRMRRDIAPLADFRAILELRALYRRYRPDVINLHSSKAGALGRIAFPPASVAYTVHGFESIALGHRRLLGIEKLLSLRSARLVAVSEYDKRALVAHGIRCATVIRYGITDPTTTRTQATLGALEDLRGRHGFLAISIARISPQKRFHTVLDAATLLRPDGIGVAWVGGAEAPPVEFPENFAFVADRPNAAELLHLADAFILATNYEGLPLSIIEALAWGKPIVASRVSGLAEQVEDGVNGFLVGNDPAAFAAALRRLRADPELSAQMGAASRQRYEAYFGLKRMLDDYERLYEDLACGAVSTAQSQSAGAVRRC